jgi:hypothetical protein
MPAKVDKIIIGHTNLKKVSKLLSCQKERIFQMHHVTGSGIRELSRTFKVSRRLIQFICYPERQKRNLELRNDKGGSKAYYKKEKHTISMKTHREYKKNFL